MRYQFYEMFDHFSPLILTCPLRPAAGQDRDRHQHGARLLPPAVRGHHRQDVAPGLHRGELLGVGDDAGLADPEGLVGTGDGVLADVPEGRGAVSVSGGELEDEVRQDALLHLAAVLLLTPLGDVLVDILHRHLNVHAEIS